MRIARNGGKAIGENAPAIARVAMFRSTRGRDDAAQPARFQDARDLAHRLPEKFRVLKRLTRDQHIGALALQFAPVIGVLQNDIDVRARGESRPM